MEIQKFLEGAVPSTSFNSMWTAVAVQAIQYTRYIGDLQIWEIQLTVAIVHMRQRVSKMDDHKGISLCSQQLSNKQKMCKRAPNVTSVTALYKHYRETWLLFSPMSG